MRNQDPKYIVNLLNQLVGADIIKGLSDHWGDYPGLPTLWDLQKLFGKAIEPKLDSMRAETLARIIEYSDVRVQVGNPPIKRRGSIHDYFGQTTQWPTGVRSSGRALLHELAFVTLLMIIMDIIKQEEYKEADEIIAEEREDEELQRRYLLPSDHPLYGKPLCVKF